MTWDQLGDWWRTELETDPAYDEEVTPLLLELARIQPGWRVLDAGCGEGRLLGDLTAAGAKPIGLDSATSLLQSARRRAPVVRGELPALDCFARDAFDAVVVSLVLEHLVDAREFFQAAADVTRFGGVLAVVVNHPYFTAPESAPIQEPDEVLWRPGTYLDDGYTDEPAGGASIRFHHRPMGHLLTMAADAGWDLRRMVEHGVTDAQVDRTPVLAGQRHIPRVLGVRWVRRADPRD